MGSAKRATTIIKPVAPPKPSSDDLDYEDVSVLAISLLHAKVSVKYFYHKNLLLTKFVCILVMKSNDYPILNETYRFFVFFGELKSL